MKGYHHITLDVEDEKRDEVFKSIRSIEAQIGKTQLMTLNIFASENRVYKHMNNNSYTHHLNKLDLTIQLLTPNSNQSSHLPLLIVYKITHIKSNIVNDNSLRPSDHSKQRLSFQTFIQEHYVQYQFVNVAVIRRRLLYISHILLQLYN